MTPLISIVMSSYNAEKYLPLTLDSVRAQTFQAWECIVVDDGSSDGTLAVARRYAAQDPRFKAVTQANGGISAARNFGVTHCAPGVEYLNFLDADDILHPDGLEALLAPLAGDPEAVGSGALADYIDSDGVPIDPGLYPDFCRSQRLGFDGERISVLPPGARTTLALLANCDYFVPPGVVLVRRGPFERVGGFDPALRRGGEDWDLFARLARLGDFLFVDNVIIDYRRHGGNASGNVRAMHAAGHRVVHKLFFGPENTPKQRRMLKRAYRAWQLHKFEGKRDQLRASLARRDYRAAALNAVHAVGHLAFRLRGFPTVKG